MNARFVRWSLLGLLALLLATTFLVMQFREIQSSLRPSEPPPVLGQLPDFALLGRDGSTVRLADLSGEPWVADFVFTRCALSCPRLTSIMLRLGADAPGVTRVSITVDPDHDTPEVLSDYADSYAISDSRWRFLTGSEEQVESLVIEGFKLPIVRQPPPELANPEEPILHSNRFVLVDGGGAIRGYYEATDEGEYEKLLADLRSLKEASLASGEESGRVEGMASISAQVYEREIEELHEFFTAWFKGTIPRNDAVLGRFADVLAPDFAIIGPEGLEFDRQAIVDRVEGAHGSRASGEFDIWIENVRVRDCGQERCLVTYEEWQRADGEARGRLSTVLFGERQQAPNGLAWVHVHETWLPEEPPGEV